MLTPRWYQAEAEEACWQYLCNSPGNPLIVLPTGAGKSLVIAMLARRAVEQFGGRVIILAHRQELLVQNAEKVKLLMPGFDIGVYSAGLGQRDTDQDIILAGIQSVSKRAHEFGNRHLVITDEAHLIPADGDGQYQTFFKGLKKFCPNLRAPGLTATPFRTSEGSICRPGAPFQAVCYSAPISRLIAEGFLSNLTTVPAVGSVDTSKLHVRAGEFVDSEVNALFDTEAKVSAACIEIVMKTTGRKSTLIFCPGVHHAECVQKKIEELTGEECGIVTAKTSKMERAAYLQRFRDGVIKRLVNIDVLTTGFDAPCIDAIAVLRATMSPGLFAQICGRGLRTSPGKFDCLILDFGENIKRHGPLDSDTYGALKDGGRGKGDGTGEAPTKVCPSCEEPCPISARECECGWIFPAPEVAKHGTNPDGSAILEKDVIPDRWIVEEVMMSRHIKRGDAQAPNTLRVDYRCQPAEGPTGGMTSKVISEWVCLEHEGYALSKAKLWWSARSNSPVDGIDDAISLWKRGAVATPFAITTRPDGKFTKIVSVELDPKPETWQPEPEPGEAHDSDFEAFSYPDGSTEDDVPF